ncbi:MAG: curved DNA-binding protein [Gammaproteobacteria bacterium]
MKYQDFYQILGVPRDASEADIKKSYRKMARQYHPDVNSAADAEEKFKEANEAYDVLKDTEKRQAYDRFGNDWKHGQQIDTGQYASGGFSGGDFSDFFESIFGGGHQQGAPFRQGRTRQPLKGEDKKLKLDISLEEAFKGGAKTIQFAQKLDVSGGLQQTEMKKLKINLPVGVVSGQKIRLGGQGQVSDSGGARGDLILEMNLLPHRYFKLENRDVLLRLPITPWEAALGSSLQVPTLEGTVDLKIKPGMQSGQKMRLKGRGMPGNPTGDQFVEILIQTPPADNVEAEEFYRDMEKKFDFNPRRF